MPLDMGNRLYEEKQIEVVHGKLLALVEQNGIDNLLGEVGYLWVVEEPFVSCISPQEDHLRFLIHGWKTSKDSLVGRERFQRVKNLRRGGREVDLCAGPY